MGEHRFDGELPDLSEAAAQEARGRAGRAARRSSTPSSRAGDLGDRQRADARILADGIALELLYLREIRDWEWDPRLYDSFPYYDPREIVGGRLSDIIHGDFAPEADAQEVGHRAARRAAEVSRRRAGGAGASARQAPHAEGLRSSRRSRANKGRIEFFKTEVKAFVGDDPAAPRRVAALAALKKYQKFLESELAPARRRRLAARRRALRARSSRWRCRPTLTPDGAVAARRGGVRATREQSSTSVARSCTSSCGRRSRCRRERDAASRR